MLAVSYWGSQFWEIPAGRPPAGSWGSSCDIHTQRLFTLSLPSLGILAFRALCAQPANISSLEGYNQDCLLLSPVRMLQITATTSIQMPRNFTSRGWSTFGTDNQPGKFQKGWWGHRPEFPGWWHRNFLISLLKYLPKVPNTPQTDGASWNCVPPTCMVRAPPDLLLESCEETRHHREPWCAVRRWWNSESCVKHQSRSKGTLPGEEGIAAKLIPAYFVPSASHPLMISGSSTNSTLVSKTKFFLCHVHLAS